jgi:group I intron endonuclease
MSICLALIKYGYSGFKLEILEYCNPEERFIRESYYINLCKPEYNILKEGGTMPSRLGTSHTENTKLKIRLSNPNRLMISVTDILTNIETIYDSVNQAEKALDFSSGQISQYFNKDQKKPFKKRYILKKIENINLKKEFKEVESWRAGVELSVLDITNNTTRVFPSIRTGARELDIAHSTILKYAKLSKPYLDKYLFKLNSTKS